MPYKGRMVNANDAAAVALPKTTSCLHLPTTTDPAQLPATKLRALAGGWVRQATDGEWVVLDRSQQKICVGPFATDAAATRWFDTAVRAARARAKPRKGRTAGQRAHIANLIKLGLL